MNLQNVIRMLELGELDNYSVFDTEGLPRLACDGKVLALAGELPLHTAQLNETMIVKGSRKLWAGALKAERGDRLEVGGIIGAFNGMGYIRPCRAGDFTTYIQERYRRWFDADAEFFRARPGKTGDPILVYEGGNLAGVVMPTKCEDPDMWPVVPFLEDDVLYHDCEPCEYCS